jgi:hypothetical protein
MAEEKKKTVGVEELIEFGEYLNECHGTDRTFEMVDASRHMKTYSLDDVIATFQAFINKKTESFKVRITFDEGRPGMMCKTIEFTRG